ncbi:hypothetical protein Q8F55_001216 [Vanrija albida]|uniref:Uncharacterized protein n=1 Tax=Vanrija albida TaxID=181172 RepID=A0ABR3QFF2_9TREE
MGGKNFGTEARRFTTAEHDAMFMLARSRTAHFFTSMRTYQPLKGKETHGDIDILAGWAGLGWAAPKGSARGDVEPVDGADLTGVTIASEPADLICWCNAIAHAVGATQWIRSGSCLSTAVPASVLFDAVPTLPGAAAATDFFQVDFMLFPPEAVEFGVFAFSHGSGLMLLAPLLRQSTRVHGLMLHAHCLEFRQHPFPGLRAVDTHLSHSGAEICKWLGLDYAVWAKGEFDSMDDVYRWLSTVDDDSLAAVALKNIARKGIDRSGRKGTHHKSRLELYPEFIAFLQSTKWAPGAEERAAIAAEVELEREPAPEAKLDPDHPKPLTPAEERVLEYWGQRGAYDALVAALEPEARLLHERQSRPKGLVKFPPKRGSLAEGTTGEGTEEGTAASNGAAATETA